MSRLALMMLELALSGSGLSKLRQTLINGNLKLKSYGARNYTNDFFGGKGTKESSRTRYS